ncbi:triose-phosphate isomerase [Leisingera aquaemixtae]|uniref:triose-phosphate isomerase n=1 Tax=Leisingera aquaemixtae TaxID=1396826 RepID=UPI0021A7BB38|nr:triose-phosphate isomerase [Leisingera aquaemixtae]UWQ23451.1 triose-phosphate isomerase [Leisingera aquaemixtae]UWQ44336.1 triose-phosphate isomerase [Leisingera aquaemixtae]
MRRKLAAGNWKMNGTGAALAELAALAESHPAPAADILICPPATLLSRAAEAARGIAIGGQDCHAKASGAHTGDLSAAMLKDAGASAVILGHSERRADHSETDAQVCAKAEAAMAEGLTAVICIGETLAEREAGDTLKVAGTQLAGSVPANATGANTVIAYEPVWAIGTGKVPTLEQIAEVHDFLRAELTARFGAGTADSIRLLYGGSVKPSNAAEIFAVSNVDGALVGGASLKAADFSPIITALEAS